MTVLTRVGSPRPPLAQLVRFGVVGASNTVIALAAYAALGAVGTPAALAALAGWALGALNGYRLNRGWTFHSAVSGTGPAARYVVVQGVAAGVDALAVALVVGHEHVARIAGQVAILPVVTLATFLICRRWVFSAGARA
ncbi:MAG TPA: GtrA family protein [Baekduia sp.]|jgi:putative flippase GtrA|nr:GtrA family protein [Baekduia sp.]